MYGIGIVRLILESYNLFDSLFQEEMTNALATMRVDYDMCAIKNLEDTNNPILKKRKKKSNPIEEAMEIRS